MTTLIKQTIPKRHLRAELSLLGITLLWGSTFAAIRGVLPETGPWFCLSFRFGIAALLVLLWRPSALRIRGLGHEWRIALWLGLWLGIGYVTQTVGLVTTEAPRSAFITALYVVFVPILQMVILRRLPSRGASLGVGLALIGLWLFTNPTGGELVAGDLWTLGCAVAWSIYIIELQRLGERVDLGRLVFAQFAVLALFSGGMTLTEDSSVLSLSMNAWLILLFLAVICTFFTTVVHNAMQRHTTPTRAALIFAAEPVFGSFVAWVLIDEKLSALGIAGAVLILLGIVASESL